MSELRVTQHRPVSQLLNRKHALSAMRPRLVQLGERMLVWVETICLLLIAAWTVVVMLMYR